MYLKLSFSDPPNELPAGRVTLTGPSCDSRYTNCCVLPLPFDIPVLPLPLGLKLPSQLHHTEYTSWKLLKSLNHHSLPPIFLI